MQIIDRIGIDIGIKKSVEDGLLWAAAHGLHYVDCRLDTSPDALVAFTSERCEAIRTRAEADGITIGLHTLSAVNIAEYSPYLAEAADHYLRAYIDIAKALNAGWVDVGCVSQIVSLCSRIEDLGIVSRDHLNRLTEIVAFPGTTPSGSDCRRVGPLRPRLGLSLPTAPESPHDGCTTASRSMTTRPNSAAFRFPCRTTRSR